MSDGVAVLVYEFPDRDGDFAVRGTVSRDVGLTLDPLLLLEASDHDHGGALFLEHQTPQVLHSVCQGSLSHDVGLLLTIITLQQHIVT